MPAICIDIATRSPRTAAAPIATEDDVPLGLAECPFCGRAPFLPYFRGLVRRSPRWLGIGPKRPTSALICACCGETAGYEEMPDF